MKFTPNYNRYQLLLTKYLTSTSFNLNQKSKVDALIKLYSPPIEPIIRNDILYYRSFSDFGICSNITTTDRRITSLYDEMINSYNYPSFDIQKEDG